MTEHDEDRIEAAAERAIEIAEKAQRRGRRASYKAMMRTALEDDGTLHEIERGGVDFRIVTVTAEDGPIGQGMWCSHSLAAARGVRGSQLSPRVRGLVEALAGKRALLAHRIGGENTQLRPADAETWAKLLMLCAAGVAGYEMECF